MPKISRINLSPALIMRRQKNSRTNQYAGNSTGTLKDRQYIKKYPWRGSGMNGETENVI